VKSKDTIALFIPTLLGGGAERVFVNLANYFAHRSYNVWLLTSKKGIYFDVLDSNVKLFYIHKPSNFLSYYISGVIRVVYFLLKYRPSFFMCTLSEAILIGSIAKKISFSKTSIILRQAFIITENTKVEKFYTKLLAWSFKNAGGIIANSQDTAQSIKEKCTIDRDIQVLPNPIYDPNALALAKKEFEKPVKNNFILAIGNLKKEKDFKTLISAFSIVKKEVDIDLIILGEGPERENLTEQISRLNLRENVKLLGFIKNPYPYLYNTKLFVLSSNYEGFGNVLVEALSVGTSIVSTACAGGPNYILDNGKYGKLTPVGNYELLAKNIQEALKNPSNKENLIRRAKDFSIESVGEKYLSYIKRCK
jgi:Glycosyltransferase